MSILNILNYPDKKLRTIAKSVKIFGKKISFIVNDMFDTMYHANGIGLAATQVNIHVRIIVVDISEKKNQPLVMINPIIIKKSGSISLEEGCLSIPNQRAYIKRHQTIQVSALDVSGNFFQIKAKNLLSICIQHEIDHLNGKLFIDYLSAIKRHMIYKKAKKTLKIKKIHSDIYHFN